jgi:hypothetical protein
LVAKKDPKKYTEEEFYKLYTQETGKNPVWGGKVTKAYTEWLIKKKEQLDLLSSSTISPDSDDSDSDTEEDEKHYLSDEEMEIMEDYKKELLEMREKLEKEEIYQKSAENYGGYTFESSIDDHIIDEDTLDYNKLTDEDERRKIRQNMAKAHVFLEKLGIQDMNIDPKKSIIIVPFEYESYQFLSHIIVGSDWFIVKASIMELSEVAPHVTNQIFVELLKANFILNDVTYSLDPEGKSVWTEADIPSDLDFEHFKLEYLSIVFAIDFFIKHITDKIQGAGENLHSTYHPGEEGDKNSLYI